MITGGAQQRAEKAASKATGAQSAVLARIVKLFDTLLSKVQGAEQAGQFDPQRQIALAEQISDTSVNRLREGAAGAARIMGYRPGDTPPIDVQRGITEDYLLNRAQQRFNIQQGSFQNMLGAYQAVNPGALGIPAQGYGQQAQSFLSNAPNPADFWRSLLGAYAMSQRA